MSDSNLHPIIAAVFEPYLAREQRKDEVRQSAHEAQHSRGVSWSGMGPAPRNPRTPEQIRADAEVAAEKAARFGASARGRFLLAIRELQNLGWDTEAERARAACSRGFARPDEPACPVEIGRALASIEPIQHSEARKACLALAELLCATVALAAE